ncbi:uncharacterized protein [Anoplolepis gracilipes]|uniref:uncharacterized protein isoform X12 n=1 Tax=Anoplolepis gracilipes TaxID=354296 RepID=UPI003BA3DC73
MAMVNMNNLLNGKDSRWLQLEVCREFQRNKCTRPDTECKFAHPPANVEVQNGRVTACYDSIKVREHRESGEPSWSGQPVIYVTRSRRYDVDDKISSNAASFLDVVLRLKVCIAYFSTFPAYCNQESKQVFALFSLAQKLEINK